MTKTASRRRKKGRPAGVSTFSVLAIARLKQGLSQQEVAKATHYSQSYVSKVEKGAVPDVLYFYRSAKLFKVPSIGDLLEQYIAETLDRISSFVKAAPPKHQPVFETEANLGESESNSSTPASEDSPIDERVDVDSEATTP